MTVNGSGPPTTWIQEETFANDLDENSPPGQPANLRGYFFKQILFIFT